MARVYASLIEKGKRTVESVQSVVPIDLWEQIDAILIEDGYYDVD